MIFFSELVMDTLIGHSPEKSMISCVIRSISGSKTSLWDLDIFVDLPPTTVSCGQDDVFELILTTTLRAQRQFLPHVPSSIKEPAIGVFDNII
jgi:hypothetical protein